MNRKTVTAVYVLIVSFATPFALLTEPVSADIIEVPYDYETIHEAVSAANISDTILVHAGAYTEYMLLITKKLTIIGDGSDSTIVETSSTSIPIMEIYDNVTITGFTFRKRASCRYHSSICVYGSGNNISNCNFVHYGHYVGSGIGIFLDNASINYISGNTFSNIYIGIYLKSSTRNIVIENTMADNKYGLILDESNDNTFCHNNFINNTQQLYIQTSGCANFWDSGYPYGGNYWSDYEDRYPDAEEKDESGIWDTPYVIDANNQDNYPLVPEFPTWTSTLLLLIVLTVVAAISKQKLLKTPTHQQSSPSSMQLVLKTALSSVFQ